MEGRKRKEEEEKEEEVEEEGGGEGEKEKKKKTTRKTTPICGHLSECHLRVPAPSLAALSTDQPASLQAS